MMSAVVNLNDYYDVIYNESLDLQLKEANFWIFWNAPENTWIEISLAFMFTACQL